MSVTRLKIYSMQMNRLVIETRGRYGIGRAFYYFLMGKRVVVLHAFIKKSQQTPAKELNMAPKRL